MCRTPRPYSAGLGVQDGANGESLVLRTRLVAALRRDRSVGKGSVTYAEGHLYALSEDGVVGLIEATPARYKEISRFEISRGSYPTWTPPVVANGKLYLREQDNLYCYDIKR